MYFTTTTAGHHWEYLECIYQLDKLKIFNHLHFVSFSMLNESIFHWTTEFVVPTNKTLDLTQYFVNTLK